MQKLVDLRSDTVTKPTLAMRQAMMAAEVGDDVFGEDPTVNRLEKVLAKKVGMDSALFVSSGTQSNLLAVMSHCERGDEYIAGHQAHVYRWEGGGSAVLGSVQPQPIEAEEDGTLDLNKVQEFIKPDDSHHARTRLLCLENTISGKVLPLAYLEKAREFCLEQDLRLHLDGARVFNAAVKLGIDVKQISHHFDSISICLSKGLGAPVGSVLCGSSDFIKKARRWRKVLGGGMRQAGFLAAAGLYALENHIERLAEDHKNATFLAKELGKLKGLRIDLKQVQTNMLFVEFEAHDFRMVTAFLKEKGILVYPSKVMRLVTHLDVSADDLKRVIEGFREALQLQHSPSQIKKDGGRSIY